MERLGLLIAPFTLLLLMSFALPMNLNVTHRPSVAQAKIRATYVCYPDVGCFHKNGTFSGIIIMLPESPEKIGTTFTLFTKNNINSGQDIHYSRPDSLMTTLFDSAQSTVILVHGFAVSDDPRGWFLKYAFLNHTSCQVIVVDWRKGAVPPEYWTAAVNSELVGRQIGVLINELKEKRNLQPYKVHILGSSLGAHAAGFAGKWVRDKYGFILGRISGNDPAGPFFHDSKDTVHLSSNDAHFVDVIHTNGGRDMLTGQAGMEKAIGHVDFYPNGGKLQPGCTKGDPTCSHMRADDLYADSINVPGCRFKSFSCPRGIEGIGEDLCTNCGERGCSELGFLAIERSGRGIQYLQTEAARPFCRPL